MPRTKQTPLADDKTLIKKLLEEQSNPMETFKKYSFDEMKQALQAWLAPEAEEGEIIDDEKEVETEEPAPWETPTPTKKNYSLEVKPKTLRPIFRNGG